MKKKILLIYKILIMIFKVKNEILLLLIMIKIINIEIILLLDYNQLLLKDIDMNK